MRNIRNDYQGAIDDFTRALQKNPNSSNARTNLEKAKQALEGTKK